MARLGRAAVAEQLRDRILGGLHVGRYAGGERLPGTRALAAELGVNERVVMAALHMLEREGLVVLRPRSGAFIVSLHADAGALPPGLATWLVNTLVAARARGLAPRAVADYVRRCLETRRVRAVCIECNEDQRHLLCHELAEDHGFVTEPLDLDALQDGAEPVAVRRADVLVTTMFHGKAIQSYATRVGKPWIAVSLRSDIMRQVSRWLSLGPLYYVATDPRFEPKLRRMLAGARSLKNLRVLLVGRDDLDQIPADAPTYVMTSARRQLARKYGARGGPGRPIHPPRHFSDEAARELLTFIVRANTDALATAAGRRG